ncbi:MAG: hypothetical protein E3J52_00455 [Promethearchaeota archaeon]|nr:MAG: hypothetical protein E3J52_00455 [Candidatus Lokiarchaeota archaeon]
MTETTRTTVTLSRISMNEVKELVGVFGNTPASVISRIVDHFFDYGRFDDVIEKMRAKKRELFPPDDAIINERIKNLFKGADKIPFADFINFLQVDKKLVMENIHIWTEKYNIKIIENLVIKDLE